MKEVLVGFTKNLEDGTSISGQVSYNAPESDEEAKSSWGGDVLLGKAMKEIVRNIQSICRSAGSEEEAQQLVSSWVPGLIRERQTSGVSKKALLTATTGMSESDLAALIAEIKAKRGLV